MDTVRPGDYTTSQQQCWAEQSQDIYVAGHGLMTILLFNDNIQICCKQVLVSLHNAKSGG